MASLSQRVRLHPRHIRGSGSGDLARASPIGDAFTVAGQRRIPTDFAEPRAPAGCGERFADYNDSDRHAAGGRTPSVTRSTNSSPARIRTSSTTSPG